MATKLDSSQACRWQLSVEGAVQGIGFRPFVFRLASQMQLTGWVRNVAAGAEIEVQGRGEQLREFVELLQHWVQQVSCLRRLTTTRLAVRPLEADFEILASDAAGNFRLSLLPDLAICPTCRRELLDPENRRYRYPFISCVRCGPRYSIVRDLAFDRENTSLREFPFCRACLGEYQSPANARFHAQTIACHDCGPQVSLLNGSEGREVGIRDTALRRATTALKDGAIVGVMGIGGFHLLVDAANNSAVQRLRERKARDAKPLALMFSSMEHVHAVCAASRLESELLQSPAAPIVLLRRQRNAGVPIAEAVAPRNPLFGCLLAYSPLHVLLLHDFGRPVVATSGNRSEEPLCYTVDTARQRLGQIADWLLVHDRPIENPVDDSVVRVMGEQAVVLRRARGYTPQPIPGLREGPTVLAVGAQQKNSIALAIADEALLGPHLGDLDCPETIASHHASIQQWTRWHRSEVKIVATDLHPDYAATQRAPSSKVVRIAVQHHYAHVLACMLEHDLHGPVLGVAWDGTGLGSDGQIWGGEFLVVDEAGFERCAALRSFPLVGGEQAIREPRRSALGVLFETGGANFVASESEIWQHGFSLAELQTLTTMASRKLLSPRTSSAGRLFDAVASLLGIRHANQFESQAAMELEFAAARGERGQSISFELQPDGVIDWEPAIRKLLELRRQEVAIESIACAMHEGLADAILAVSQAVGLPRVVLTGGCFQNAVLLEATVKGLQRSGFQPYWPRQVPPNDGGLALGQLVAARRHYQGNLACAWQSRGKLSN